MWTFSFQSLYIPQFFSPISTRLTFSVSKYVQWSYEDEKNKKQNKWFVFSILRWTHRVSYSQSNSAERCSGERLEDHMWCNAACITLYLPQLMTVRPVSPASTTQLLWGNVVCQAQYGVSALNNGGLVLPGWHHCHSFLFGGKASWVAVAVFVIVILATCLSQLLTLALLAV